MIIEQCRIHVESWPLRTPFRISRGEKSETSVVTVELHASGAIGRGECCPYPRYGETIASIKDQLDHFDPGSIRAASIARMRQMLLPTLSPGSARNALDCALWDLEAKITGTPAWQLIGVTKPTAALTCFTLSLDTPDAMATEARRHAQCPLLKLKLGNAPHDGDRIKAVRAARPDARLVCDANEGWRIADLQTLLPIAKAAGIELIEQPLPAAEDHALARLSPVVPLCADELASPDREIASLADRYQAINIKLDKTGGLTAARTAVAEACRLDMKIMVGSMVSTSLSMAPASLLAAEADWIDLDSPLLLANDRQHAMQIDNGMLSPPTKELWG